MRRALGIGALCVAAGAAPASAQAQMTTYEQLQVFSGVLSQIRVNYVDSVNYGTLVRAAIEGMLGSLDPHSRYVSRQDFELNSAYEAGELAGAGIRLEEADDAIVVLAVEPDGPADRAGIHPGDRVRAVNDHPVAGLGADAVAVQFLGDKGTRLRLTLERGARLDPDTVAVTLRRAVIDPRVVPPPRMAAPGIGYVRLAQFTPVAPKALSDAIRKARDLGARQLILDLRGNPGGSLAAFAEIAGFFLPENVELFHADGRTRAVRDTAFTHEKGRFATLPLVVLVDEGTASAAEILAGTLQDHDRAVVVGRRTFGKALMQSALPLPGGDVVWLTTGRIVLPSGRLIQRTYQDINRSQYRARAGTAASADSVREYRTSAGRAVRGSGGIEPDVGRDAAGLPLWFGAAADSGLISAVADSVANALPQSAEALDAWSANPGRWDSELVVPFVARVRSRLDVRGEAAAPARERIARILAHRVVEVRWGTDEAAEFAIRVDPDVRLALEQFARLPALLTGSPGRQ